MKLLVGYFHPRRWAANCFLFSLGAAPTAAEKASEAELTEQETGLCPSMGTSLWSERCSQRRRIVSIPALGHSCLVQV